jgi:Erv1 / Alr family
MNKTRKNKAPIYTKDDYNSGDGMLTSVWGPSLWHFLHTMSFNYPTKPTEQEKKQYREFILNLQHTLPCKYCRINLKTNLKQLPLTMSNMKNRESFSKYVYDLHELVNKMLKKKSNLSFNDVQDRYEHFRARCTTEKPTVFKYESKSITRKAGKGKEKGCTEPMYGKKSKCIIKIVPQDVKGSTFQMDDKCIKSKG